MFFHDLTKNFRLLLQLHGSLLPLRLLFQLLVLWIKLSHILPPRLLREGLEDTEVLFPT